MFDASSPFAFFDYFRVPAMCQHRVLFYGILGALVMRGLFIGLGAVLIAKFHWILYIFGAMLVVTGVRMAIKSDDEFRGDENPIVRLVRRFVPLTRDFHGKHFSYDQVSFHSGTEMAPLQPIQRPPPMWIVSNPRLVGDAPGEETGDDGRQPFGSIVGDSNSGETLSTPNERRTSVLRHVGRHSHRRVSDIVRVSGARTATILYT